LPENISSKVPPYGTARRQRVLNGRGRIPSEFLSNHFLFLRSMLVIFGRGRPLKKCVRMFLLSEEAKNVFCNLKSEDPITDNKKISATVHEGKTNRLIPNSTPLCSVSKFLEGLHYAMCHKIRKNRFT
jgi:hypothetical protein